MDQKIKMNYIFYEKNKTTNILRLILVINFTFENFSSIFLNHPFFNVFLAKGMPKMDR